MKQLARSEVPQAILGRLSFIFDKMKISPSALSELGWSAVPVPSSDHLSVGEIESLAQFVERRGGESLYAIPVEPSTLFSEAAEIGNASQELEDLNDEFGVTDLFVVPSDPEFVILCTTSDYSIYLGEEKTLFELLGGNLQELYGRFADFAYSFKSTGGTPESKAFVNSEQQRYLRVIRICKGLEAQ